MSTAARGGEGGLERDPVPMRGARPRPIRPSDGLSMPLAAPMAEEITLTMADFNEPVHPAQQAGVLQCPQRDTHTGRVNFSGANRAATAESPATPCSHGRADRETIRSPSGDGVVDDTPALPLPVLRKIGPAYRFAAAPPIVDGVRRANHKVSATLRQPRWTMPANPARSPGRNLAAAADRAACRPPPVVAKVV